MAAWGCLIAAGRTYLDFHLGIPGHTGILWIALLIGGKLVVRRGGSGLGVSAGYHILFGALGGVAAATIFGLIRLGTARKDKGSTVDTSAQR
ncbi:MAG: hypothetical protein M1343_05660 [Chloroflexi bacterium]|nr:hypothetical protein [Chloroflexota bacterium]MDA8189798.1 hypothetical protein [Dehalococcoidales bacterium]